MQEEDKPNPKIKTFYNNYNEIVRLRGHKYMTVFDFIAISNLRLFLETLNITPRELSKMIGVSSETVSNLIELKIRLSADYVYKISVVLDIPMSEFYVDRTEFMGETPILK